VEDVEFQIFIPNEKKHWLTPNVVLITAFTISFAFLWLSDTYLGKDSSFHSILLSITLLILVVAVGFMFFSFFSYEPLNGVIDGEIIFKDDRIVVNDKDFGLGGISDIDFLVLDFYGRSDQFTVDLNPRMSQGVNNYVTFTDYENNTQKVYFKLESKLQREDLISFINNAVKLDKMKHKKAIELWGVKQYLYND